MYKFRVSDVSFDNYRRAYQVRVCDGVPHFATVIVSLSDVDQGVMQLCGPSFLGHVASETMVAAKIAIERIWKEIDND